VFAGEQKAKATSKSTENVAESCSGKVAYTLVVLRIVVRFFVLGDYGLLTLMADNLTSVPPPPPHQHHHHYVNLW